MRARSRRPTARFASSCGGGGAGSRSWWRMTGPASRRTPSTASSSASTPTGRSRDSGRIRAWACRSRARSSSPTRELLAAARQRGRFGRLVSDDRTRLEARHGRLIARPVEAISGLIEVRGLGLVASEHEAAGVVGLLVELWADEPPRLPEAAQARVTLCGVVIPRIYGRRGAPIGEA